MKADKVNFYFFGEPGAYDSYSPSYICNRKHAGEIVYQIANQEPFSISKYEIIERLHMEESSFDEVIGGLLLIEAIEAKENTYRIRFPIFLEKDVVHIGKHLSKIGQVIGDKIIDLKEQLYEKIAKLASSRNFSKERLLYHIICDKVFDGTALDFFSQRNVFSTTKQQPGNRDYIIVAFEDSDLVEKYSNKLLCSSNNYTSTSFTFNSFGDSDGLRKDMFRFFRLMQRGIEGATPFRELNLSYIKVMEDINRNIAQKCGRLMFTLLSRSCSYTEFIDEERNLLSFLEEMDYICIDEQSNVVSVNVPIFTNKDEDIVKEISDIILNSIFSIVRDTFINLEENAPEMTSIRHKVDFKEVGNELWHQIFGATNEYMTNQGFAEQPKYIKGQGRYLRSISVDKA